MGIASPVFVNSGPNLISLCVFFNNDGVIHTVKFNHFGVNGDKLFKSYRNHLPFKTNSKKTAEFCIFLRTKQKIHDIIQIVNRNKKDKT